MTTMLDRPPTESAATDTTGGEEYAERYKRAREHVRAVRGFFIHLTIYLTVNAFLLALNLITSPHSLWFYWPLLGWGIGVAINGVVVLLDAPLGTRWEERKIHEYMERDK